MSGAAGGAMPEDGPDLDAFAERAESLADHLLAQAGTVFSGREAVIARHLIDQIDETGYLAAPLLDIANRLGAPLPEVAAVLVRIQTFAPTGVGARDLAVCLALQAKEADRYGPCMARLHEHLDPVARGALARLRRL